MKKRDWNKICLDYYNDILSPIKNSVKNPLFSDLKKIKSKKKKIIDLGCGLGELEHTLSKLFKQVVSVDISPKMIEQAKIKNKKFSNVEFYVKDMSDLKEFHNKFNVALAINSHLSCDLKKLDKMFKETYNVLKEGGVFIGIFPSMEVYLYEAMLISRKKSRKIVKKFFNDKEHDFLLSTIDFEGKQKNYYRFEIFYYLKKAGFKNIKISKVLYSWKEFKEAGQIAFPKEELLPWDWYIVCEK